MRTIQGALIYHSLYEKVSGYKASRDAIKKNDNDDFGNKFLYGDLPLITWTAIVNKANPKKDGVFFDLGSGIGKAVVLSHLLCDFRKSIGIELLEGLYDKSCEIMEQLEGKIKPGFAQYLQDREMIFINDNIFNINLHEADFIFLNYPLGDEESFLFLEKKFLEELQPKTKIVTTIRSLKNPAFKMFHETSYRFSWGKADAYFYEI
jgi:hypothetical protein